MKPKIKDR